ncbi:MAG: hypothetical protein RJA70_767 [Pseudomonadota bacterium]|jgi:DNA-binding beta-propeller fold protein YncE
MIARPTSSCYWIVAAFALPAFSCGRSGDDIAKTNAVERRAESDGGPANVTPDAAIEPAPVNSATEPDAQAPLEPLPRDHSVELPAPPVVKAEVSAAYDWKECGRIEPRGRIVAAAYAPDDSVLTLWNDGRVERHVDGSNTGTLLAEGKGPQDNWARAFQNQSIDLSSDGKTLLAGPEIYRRMDGGPVIGGEASAWTVVSLAGAPCGNINTRLSGSYVVGIDENDLCVWAQSDGSLSFNVRLPGSSEAWDSAQVANQTVVAAAGGSIYSYSLTGVPQVTLEPAGLPRRGLFTPDGLRYVGLVNSSIADYKLFLASFDVVTGKEVWRVPLSEHPAQLALSGDGTRVYAARQGLFQVSDGKPLSSVPNRFHSIRRVKLDHHGQKRLNLDFQLSEWDLATGRLNHQYGSILGPIDDIEISLDGNSFATHSNYDKAIVWHTEPEFAFSRPVFSGAAGDGSWNVALATNGEALLVSGDNLGLSNSAGGWMGNREPSLAGGCLSSAHASFSMGGRWVAGTNYSEQVFIFDAATLDVVAKLEAQNCGGGVAFSRDGTRLYTASLGVYEVASWRELSPPSKPLPASGDFPVGDRIELSPNGLEALVSTCNPAAPVECQWERYDVSAAPRFQEDLPPLTGMRASYSPESHWVVSAGELLHLPSKTQRQLPGEVRASAFFPNGDLVAGYTDGSVVRYCRQ